MPYPPEPHCGIYVLRALGAESLRFFVGGGVGGLETESSSGSSGAAPRALPFCSASHQLARKLQTTFPWQDERIHLPESQEAATHCPDNA
jgi:hypothetical protein